MNRVRPKLRDKASEVTTHTEEASDTTFVRRVRHLRDSRDFRRIDMQAVTVDVVTNEADAFTTKITLNRPRADVVFVQDLDDEGEVVRVVLFV